MKRVKSVLRKAGPVHDVKASTDPMREAAKQLFTKIKAARERAAKLPNG